MIFGTVCCLGDSITEGSRAQLGFPEILPALLNVDSQVERTEWATLNRGIAGQTTRQILDRAPAATRELAGMPGAKWMVILAGTNDSKAGGKIVPGNKNKTGGRISHAEYESLMRQILHWPRRHGIPVVLCTHPPIDPIPMPTFTEASRTWLDVASQIVVDLAEELDCEGAPIGLCELRDMPRGFVCGDGIHLIPEGYAWIAWRLATLLGAISIEPEVPPRAPPPPKRERREGPGPIVVTRRSSAGRRS